jgi:hypothetical protein
MVMVHVGRLLAGRPNDRLPDIFRRSMDQYQAECSQIIVMMAEFESTGPAALR